MRTLRALALASLAYASAEGLYCPEVMRSAQFESDMTIEAAIEAVREAGIFEETLDGFLAQIPEAERAESISLEALVGEAWTGQITTPVRVTYLYDQTPQPGRPTYGFRVNSFLELSIPKGIDDRREHLLELPVREERSAWGPSPAEALAQLYADVIVHVQQIEDVDAYGCILTRTQREGADIRRHTQIASGIVLSASGVRFEETAVAGWEDPWYVITANEMLLGLYPSRPEETF